MRRRFEYRDEKSEKFWEIELKGSSFTTYYGKIGGGPRQDTKEWSSPAEAKKEYEKIVAEKMKKGYEEVSEKKSSDKENTDSKKKKSIEVNKQPVTPGKDRRRFEYKDEKSNKFWEIELIGTAYTTYYGKIGGSSRADVNDFGSEAEAEKQYEKIIAEKLKKGYEEVSGVGSEKKKSENVKTTDNPEFAKFKVPAKFKKAESKIRSTLKLSVKIDLKGKPSFPWSSKVGGKPYLPAGTDYPSVKKKPLFFLAQINFAEIPSLPDYPSKGILQFFISDDELYGLNLDSPFKSNYKVIYYPDIIQDKNKLTSDFSFLPEFKYTPLDSDHEVAMRFRSVTVPISGNDYRFEELFPELSDDYDLLDEYQEFCGAQGTKIGGYSDFVQEDPRVGNKSLKGYELLFQLDSEGDICWGDMGVGNFFIKPEDLKKLDFSQVLYNWDCS